MPFQHSRLDLVSGWSFAEHQCNVFATHSMHDAFHNAPKPHHSRIPALQIQIHKRTQKFPSPAMFLFLMSSRQTCHLALLSLSSVAPHSGSESHLLESRVHWLRLHLQVRKHVKSNASFPLMQVPWEWSVCNLGEPGLLNLMDLWRWRSGFFSHCNSLQSGQSLRLRTGQVSDVESKAGTNYEIKKKERKKDERCSTKYMYRSIYNTYIHIV